MSRPLALRAALLILGACALLDACAWLRPQMVAPQLSVVGIDIERAGLLQQDLRVRMRVVNPNDHSLRVRRIEYTLYVEQQETAHGVSLQRFTVPAQGEAEFDTEVTTHVAGMLFAVLGHGTPAPIHYRVVGKVELSLGIVRTLPFQYEGIVPLG